MPGSFSTKTPNAEVRQAKSVIKASLCTSTVPKQARLTVNQRPAWNELVSSQPSPAV